MDLYQRVNEIRASAARFYVVDLHVHSPYSYDWINKGGKDQPRNKNLDRISKGKIISEESVSSYCNDIKESGREIIAITDHNRSRFSEAIINKKEEINLCVLPGIELSVAFSDAPLIKNMRIHVLAIFPQDTHREAIARILPSGTPDEDTRDPKKILKYKAVDDLIDRIHNEGGIAIAAHIESSNGLRGIYKNTIEFLLEPISGSHEARSILQQLGNQVKDELVKFDAIQVKLETDLIHYKGPSGNLRVPLIVATDCHSGKMLSEQQYNNYTYIKMATPSFNSLNDALKFPDLRIRFATGLPETKPPRILGLRIVGHKETGNTFFYDTILGFSDNLTCIIGPRGSGKSAMIDGLRYLMGYNRTLDRIHKVENQIKDRQKNTLERSRIEALFQTENDIIYKIVATYDPQEDYVTEVYDLDGNRLNIEDVEACGEFPLNLYGWGELELLAEIPDNQRELLDRFIPNIKEMKDEKNTILNYLEENRKKSIKKAEVMENFFNDTEKNFLRIDEYKEKYDELNTDEIEVIFAQIDEIRAKKKILNSIDNAIQEALDNRQIAAPLKLSDYFTEEDLADWYHELMEKLRSKELDDWILKISKEYENRIIEARDLIQCEKKELGSLEDKAEKEIQSVIGDEQVITGDLRNRAKMRYEKAKTNYEEYIAHKRDFENLLDKRKSLLDKLEECYKIIFTTRNRESQNIKKKVSLVEDDNYQIDLVLKQQQDRRILQDKLKQDGLLFHGHWKAQKHCEILSQNMTPRKLADAIMEEDFDSLCNLKTNIDGKDYVLSKENAEKLTTENKPFSVIESLDVYHIDKEKLDRIFKLQQIPIDDDFYITLGGKPIQYCSPGQRCSAMLPVVALTSQAPLIIDQPEDNLDNRLVSRALFKILSRLKETRQLIFATHNPNILVSGDAEQVLLLDSEGNLEVFGCIDDEEIINSVISLMEGGVEAFHRRRTKYEPFL